MSDTPRTDEVFCEAQDMCASSFVVPLEHARQLERELAEAKELCALTEQRLLDATLRPTGAERAEAENEVLREQNYAMNATIAEMRAGETKVILENQHLHHENIRLRDELAAQVADLELLSIQKGELKEELAALRAASAVPKLPSMPVEIQEWCWHLDLHLTEHDIQHAGKALRAAWPCVAKWLRENVGPRTETGKPFV